MSFFNESQRFMHAFLRSRSSDLPKASPDKDGKRHCLQLSLSDFIQWKFESNLNNPLTQKNATLLLSNRLWVIDIYGEPSITNVLPIIKWRNQRRSASAFTRPVVHILFLIYTDRNIFLNSFSAFLRFDYGLWNKLHMLSASCAFCTLSIASRGVERFFCSLTG